MASDDENHTTTVYDDIDDDEEQQSEEEEEQNQNHTLQIEDEEDINLIDNEDEEEEFEEEEEENDSTSSAAGEVTIAVAGIPNTTATTPPPTTTATASVIQPDSAIVEAMKKPPIVDDSRRLFQRLWTDEDEIELLQGFLDYTTQRGMNNSSNHHHHDTAAFYDQIKGKLQLDFNKNQLVEKLRRLKKKYRNVLSKISSGKDYLFKSPHDQATFEISCKIWGDTAATTTTVPATGGDGGGIEEDEQHNHSFNPNFTFNLNDHNGSEFLHDPNSSEKKGSRSRKRSRTNVGKFEENLNQQQQFGSHSGGSGGIGVSGSNPANIANVVEETVKSCLLPLFKELVNNNSSPNNSNCGGGSRSMNNNMNPFGGLLNFSIGDMSNEKWRKQHILELEVYSKRLELMQDQIKSRLEELRSMGS